jgi:dephospho-CoA kinase
MDDFQIMTDKICIAIIGEKAGGKDVVGKYLSEKYQAEVIASGDIFRDLLDVLEIDKTRENITNVAIAVRSAFGQNIAQEVTLKRFGRSNAKICVNNGLRKPEEFEHAKQLGFHFWYVTAPVEMRFERMKQRNQNADDQTQTFELFKQQESFENEKDIMRLGMQCETRIDNTGSLDDLYKRIDEEINKLM